MLKKTDQLVHPAAAALPMMSDDALDDLASDIKTRGQIHPILVDRDGVLLDGRNRLEACRRAGVDPRFETIDRPDDVDAFVASLNAKRRDLTPSTRAIAAAEAWKRAVDEGRVQTDGGDRKSKSVPKSSGLIQNAECHFAVMYHSNEKYVRQAYALVTRDPVAAANVKMFGSGLAEAYKQLQMREGKLSNENIRLTKLREARPDLAEMVNIEALSIEDAEVRAKKEADEEKQQRYTATMNLIDGVLMLDRSTERIEDMLHLYDFALADSRGEHITPDRLRNVSAFVLALADAMEDKQ